MAGKAEWTVAHSAVLNDAVIARKCEWGFSCRFGAVCLAWHSLGEHEHFAVKQQVRKREWEEKCAFCVRGCCRHGEMCRRGMDGRNVNAIETGAGLGRERGEDESDYESAEEGPPERTNDRREGHASRSRGVRTGMRRWWRAGCHRGHCMVRTSRI
jgi:hypothetical protein